MKIEAGKYYRVRRGDVVGPIQHNRYARDFPWVCLGFVWRKDGSYNECECEPHVNDIVAEVYVSDTPPADAPAPETIRLDPRTELKFFRQMGPHELVTNASVPMLETKTLRDEFAGYAIIGLLAAGDCYAFNRDEMAVEAYRQADAMMEARKK